MNKIKDSHQYYFFSLSHGIKGACWTTWTFEHHFNEDMLEQRVKSIPLGHVYSVHGLAYDSDQWVKLVHGAPILKRIK